jgi:hypothetical protein
MGLLQTWMTRPLRRRVEALVERRVEMRVAAAEAAWSARLEALERRTALAQAMAAARLETERGALAARLDGMATGLLIMTRAQDAMAQDVSALGTRQQSLAAGTAADITAMLHRLEQIRRELRHEIDATARVDG